MANHSDGSLGQLRRATPFNRRRLAWPARRGCGAALALAGLLAACGGGGGGDLPAAGAAATAADGTAAAQSAAGSASRDATATAGAAAAVAVSDGGLVATPAEIAKTDYPTTRLQAQRFLAQATFGANETDIARLMAIGYKPWLAEQFAKPASSHRATWEASNAAALAANPTGTGIGQDGTINSFWKQAVTADDPVRQRLAYALSQIFVISMVDSVVGDNPRAVAAWFDMLGDKGFGSFRQLLEAVSLHPMMGTYLSSIKNQKANAATGRIPDENYAREVMQLFTIGLSELNADGTPRLAGGLPVDTYDAADVSGLAKVFTGWSWECPAFPANGCFSAGSVNGVENPDRTFLPMRGYPQYHSTESKTFLGVTVPAQATAQPDVSLKAALDRLAGHPNVGPFICRQLIQRLVTSNPSTGYLSSVVAAFNGSGGDLKTTLVTLLTHDEARFERTRTAGKVREPVLRLAAFLRAFPHKSDSGDYKVGNTDNVGTALGQTPLRSPSVFNFYRPGYVAPGTLSAASGLVLPEMQLVNETTAAGYVNYMRDNIASGVGTYSATFARRDLQPDYSAELALADQPAALVDRIEDRLMAGAMPSALKTEIQGAVDSIAIPVRNATGSNQPAIDAAKRSRVNTAILLAVVSPEFLVQR